MYYSFGKNKTKSQVKIFLVLCLTFCFILFTSSISVFAQGHSYTTWGSYNGNTPIQEISGNFDISLTSMIEQSIYHSVFNSNDLTSLGVSYNAFIDSITYHNLGSIISNWQPGNPEYFLNISYYSNTNSNVRGFILYFSKTNGLSNYYLSVSDDNAINVNNPDCLFFDPNLSICLQDYSILSTSNIPSDSNFAKSIVLYNNFANSLNSQGTFYSNGISLPFIYNTYVSSNTLLSRFTDFLNSYDIYTFMVFIPDHSVDSSTSLQYFSNGVFLPSGGTEYNLFSTIQSYDYFDDDISFNSDVYNNLRYCLLKLKRFSTGIILQDTSDILSYGYVYGGSHAAVTPTPIPTFLWGTPTPFPNVTFIPATLTPIVVPYDPSVITGTDTFDNLAGYLGILHYYISQPVNRFMSTVITCIYSFSYWFKFILVVPIICLFAFIIGRLKRK